MLIPKPFWLTHIRPTSAITWDILSSSMNDFPPTYPRCELVISHRFPGTHTHRTADALIHNPALAFWRCRRRRRQTNQTPNLLKWKWKCIFSRTRSTPKYAHTTKTPTHPFIVYATAANPADAGPRRRGVCIGGWSKCVSWPESWSWMKPGSLLVLAGRRERTYQHQQTNPTDSTKYFQLLLRACGMSPLIADLTQGKLLYVVWNREYFVGIWWGRCVAVWGSALYYACEVVKTTGPPNYVDPNNINML